MATDRSVGSKAGEITGGTPGEEAGSMCIPRPVVMYIAFWPPMLEAARKEAAGG